VRSNMALDQGSLTRQKRSPPRPSSVSLNQAHGQALLIPPKTPEPQKLRYQSISDGIARCPRGLKTQTSCSITHNSQQTTRRGRIVERGSIADQTSGLWPNRKRGMVMRRPFTPAKRRRGAVLVLRIRHGEQSCFHGKTTTVEKRSRENYYSRKPFTGRLLHSYYIDHL
jgi:hypothetical protein